MHSVFSFGKLQCWVRDLAEEFNMLDMSFNLTMLIICFIDCKSLAVLGAMTLVVL